MEKGGISAILFDLDNTLVDTAGAGQLALDKVGLLEKDSSDIWQLITQDETDPN